MRNIAFMIVIILTVAIAVSCSLEKSADNGGESKSVSKSQVTSKQEPERIQKVIQHDNQDVLNRINSLEKQLNEKIDSVSVNVDNTEVMSELTKIENKLTNELNSLKDSLNKKDVWFKNQFYQVFAGIFAATLIIIFTIMMMFRSLKKTMIENMSTNSYKKDGNIQTSAVKTENSEENPVIERVSKIASDLNTKLNESSDLFDAEKGVRLDSSLKSLLAEINSESAFLEKAGAELSTRNRYLIGLEKLNEKNYSEASKIFESIKKEDESFSLAWFMAGYISYVTRKYDNAEINLKKACELEPENFAYFVSYGNACLKEKKYAEASDALKKAVELKPEDPSAWNNLAHSYTMANDLEKAAEAFRKASELKEDFHEALHNLGLALGKLEKYEEALEAFEKAVEVKEDKHESLYNSACIYAILGKREGALNNLKRAIELQPEYAEKAKNDKDFASFKEDSEFEEVTG
jgi:tetratricopeptide (TPR) repeat protein